MWRFTPRRGMDKRFAVLETLIVFAVLAIVVAVAVPAYAERAKESVLQQNASSLALRIKGDAVLGLDPTYVPDGVLVAGAGATAGRLSAELALDLRTGDSGRYLNPLPGSREIVCQSALPQTIDGRPPAVWITDDQGYAYSAFPASPTTTCRLRGTLVVSFITRDAHTTCLEVFYVDAAGRRSPTAAVLGIES